jgi:hypothetical protein
MTNIEALIKRYNDLLKEGEVLIESTRADKRDLNKKE